MKTLKDIVIMLVFSSIIISCKDEKVKKADDVKTLIVGEWNSYEIGSKKTGFVPGVTTSLTVMYESGIVFTSTGEFGPRYYRGGVWTENIGAGKYEIKDDQTIILVFAPKTKDELKLELKLIKLDKGYLWFQHSYYVTDQNPEPVEHHLKRLK